MPLLLDLGELSDEVVRKTLEMLRESLEEYTDYVREPRGRVLDPASLATAAELVRSARAVLDRPGTLDRAALVANANLAYAVGLAVVDLVKSHTDVPRVPVGRRAAGAGKRTARARRGGPEPSTRRRPPSRAGSAG